MDAPLCASCRHQRIVQGGPPVARYWCSRPTGTVPSLVDGRVPVSGMWCWAERKPLKQPGWLARLFGADPDRRCGSEGRFYEPVTMTGQAAHTVIVDELEENGDAE